VKTRDATRALAALAHDTRLEIFRLLVRAGPAGRPAGELAGELSVPATTMSFHLSQLAHADLVTQRRQGRSILYAVNFDSMRLLLSFLTENCCSADPAACAPPLLQPTPRPPARGRRNRP
jgi:DNA-binding transcriptional ArsR family regulator